MIVERPWGTYKSVEKGDGYQVKELMVYPGQSLSLQFHYHRDEHWVIVRGTAKVTVGEEVKLVTENESVFIKKGQVHRLENPGKIALKVIEVQYGSYLEEDDIIRCEDLYDRT